MVDHLWSPSLLARPEHHSAVFGRLPVARGRRSVAGRTAESTVPSRSWRNEQKILDLRIFDTKLTWASTHKEHNSPRGLAILLLRSKRRPGSHAEEAVRPTTAAASLPVVRPHYRFSSAIGGGGFQTHFEGEGGGLAAAAAGNDQRLDCDQEREGEGGRSGGPLATSETYVTSHSSSSRPMATAAAAAFIVFSFLFGAEKRNYCIVAVQAQSLSVSPSSCSSCVFQACYFAMIYTV